ncbi:hypothetical protein MJ1HA_1290 [Metallosphaera sedula]|nr:hypothetical protein MJ1HA_1290 [Metallosphaera sedula]
MTIVSIGSNKVTFSVLMLFPTVFRVKACPSHATIRIYKTLTPMPCDIKG